MSSDSGTERSAVAAAGAGAAAVAGAGAGAAARALHARSFKLRFAAQREPGRSYVSAVKPLALPATVTDKFYSGPREERGERGERGEREEREAGELRALRRIQALFARGPRDRHPAPLTEAQQYGWWWKRGVYGSGGGGHHIRDSAWLAARLRVLAADDKLKHK